MEPIPVYLHNAAGFVPYLFSFSLFPIENPDAASHLPQMDKNKEIDNNLKQSPLVKTARTKHILRAEIKSEKQNNMNYYQQHVALAQRHARKKK